ncbi:pseudo histidine-containing phosphotransfer protein 2-like [Diospyros lotus]|uniref:pseudo histidine-containing phosphotransfer protein 2-like n=1 Tax=Diospyros lotus TaxID=55363 RepID=UPI00224CBD41|nr:pseudo histidine-containing phosphotransfer protein 2-like [Diospyros lotus]
MERGQLDNMRQSLLDEGLIGETFIQLERLQTEADPNFIEEVVSIFYTTDSAKCLQNLEQALCKMALQQLKEELATLKGKLEAYFLLGRQVRVAEAVDGSDQAVDYQNGVSLCKMALQQLKEELATLKGKLEAYFLLGRQVRAVETADGSDQAVDHQNGVSL